MNETDIIEKYFKSDVRSDVQIGIGDDAAVLEAKGSLVMSLDSLVVERHFREMDAAVDIGYKALAVNLSDLAAMGCTPCWTMLSLSLPETIEVQWIAGFSKGFLGLCKQWEVSLIGGDLVRGPLVITVQITGQLDHNRVALSRSGAQVGDAVYITGDVGGAGVAWHRATLVEENLPLSQSCRERLLHPEPRINEGYIIATYATAAVDISDGVLLDLSRLAKSSKVGAQIHLDAVPVHPTISSFLPEEDWLLPLTAGDDYELMFTMPPSAEADLRTALMANGISTPITRIGNIIEKSGLDCQRNGESIPLPAIIGFDHFGEQIK